MYPSQVSGTATNLQGCDRGANISHGMGKISNIIFLVATCASGENLIV